MRVLLVEDEPDLVSAIQRTLHQQMYLVDWVLDGAEALAYLENSSVEYTVASHPPKNKRVSTERIALSV